jgi:hypothetical protein
MKFLLIVAIILTLSLTISGDENKKAVNGSSIEEIRASTTMSDLLAPEKTTIESAILEDGIKDKEDDIDDKEEMEVINRDDDDKDDDDYNEDDDDDDDDEDDDEDDFQLPLIATNFTGLVEMENCTVTTFKVNYIFGPMSNFRYKYVQRDGKIIYVYSVYKLDEEKIRRALLESDRIRLNNIAFAARLHAEALKEMEELAKEIEESRLRFNKMFADSKDIFRIHSKRSKFRLNHNKRDKFMDDFHKSEEKMQSEVVKFQNKRDKFMDDLHKSEEKLQGEVAKLNVVIKDLF